MKFTLSWLKNHFETTADADTIGNALTALGLEIESIDNKGASLREFTVAEILSAEQHPDADKLRVCQVKTGTDTRQIVCGAPNARAGIKVALADIGAYIPAHNITIKKSSIRGVESNGMMCSARELNLGEDHAGIIELPLDAPIGASIVDVLGLDDPLFDISVTANRPDALGVYGVARDLAALNARPEGGIGTLKPLTIPAAPKGDASPITVTITTDGCKHFVGCMIRGVKNTESPEWLKKQLESIGLRPISALVDITNYFTIGYGRPLHVFDAAKLSGNITVRTAKAGEKLAALNNKEYTLSDGMTVIADDAKVLALGGIIGGEETGCTETTTDVFLEAAWFEPLCIASTGRKLQIDSDARHRFERGVDPAFTQSGALLAIQMILDICGGTASALVEAGNAPVREHGITLDVDAINGFGGTHFSPEIVRSTLEHLGFVLKSDVAQVPSWRADVEGIADLAEEVLRVQGYHHIPSTPLPALSAVAEPILTPLQKRVSGARRLLAARGGNECYHWSFLPHDLATHFGGGSEALQLQNPISADLSDMRPSLLPQLLQAASSSANRGVDSTALFEVGLQWKDATPKGQAYVAAMLRTGEATSKGVHEAARKVDVYDAKADALAIIAQCGLPTANLQYSTKDLPAWYHPGRSAALLLGKQVIGYVGEIHPTTRKLLDVDGAAVACEIFLENIPFGKAKGTARGVLNVSDFQATTRDFAFTLPADKPANDLLIAVRKAEKQLLKEVDLFDVYQGKGVAEGEKSVALRITLQAADRTLTEDDISRISQAVVSQAAAIGAKLRA
jgi:phenylalanyl-tRNA synthetase beta chain